MVSLVFVEMAHMGGCLRSLYGYTPSALETPDLRGEAWGALHGLNSLQRRMTRVAQHLVFDVLLNECYEVSRQLRVVDEEECPKK